MEVKEKEPETEESDTGVTMGVMGKMGLGVQLGGEGKGLYKETQG